MIDLTILQHILLLTFEDRQVPASQSLRTYSSVSFIIELPWTWQQHAASQTSRG